MEKGSDNDTMITVSVKFKGQSISISLSQDSTVEDLKSLLKPLTDVLIRGQKLLFKGKLLRDYMTLRQSEVTNGAKIMLVASQSLHQGGGPVIKEPRALTNSRKADEVSGGLDAKKQVSVEKTQLQRWKVTGVVALSQSNLKFIPDEVWSCGPSPRVLDLSHNYIKDVPAGVGSLSSIQKLLLNANELYDESVSWEALTSLKSLTVLSLNQNNLTMIDSLLGSLTSLRQLNVGNNKLTCLPDELGLLTQLEVFKANNNRITTVPTSIGGCASLIEVDLSSNLLSELPETFGNLKSLKSLYLHNNGLKSLPTTLFKMCVHLSTLDLHGTEITMDSLRQLEGWQHFDERRHSKLQKQLDFRVEGSAEFDEGADKS